MAMFLDNMESEIVNSNQTDVEYVVNRWVVDYYLCLALELFQKQQYEDFRGIRDVLNSVIMVRPFEATDSMTTKLGVLKFLSRINEGESLGEININTLRVFHLTC
uniref:Uncharacterized protein n=1 Tax=Dicentrarchus labrax TaxID=13489 RepID=A0A8C4NZZ0_DICLA